MKNKYPVGATWECITKQAQGTVFLKEITPTFEIWWWDYSYLDGSGVKFDWETSKAKAVENCSTCFYEYTLTKKPRFKRIK